MDTRKMTPRFISEALRPEGDTFDTARMAHGGPGLPRAFRWGKERVDIARVRREWRDTGSCRHGSGEQYVRRHWFEVEDAAGRVLTIYFTRKPRDRAARWQLFSLLEAPAAMDGRAARG